MWALLFLCTQAHAVLPHCRELHRRTSSSSTAPPERVGLFRSTFWLGLRFYQVAISPADGSSCTMYPSCSQYAIEAIRQDGPILGTWMTAARLTRNHSDPHVPRCRGNGRTFAYNPPRDDAWWR